MQTADHRNALCTQGQGCRKILGVLDSSSSTKVRIVCWSSLRSLVGVHVHKTSFCGPGEHVTLSSKVHLLLIIKTSAILIHQVCSGHTSSADREVKHRSHWSTTSKSSGKTRTEMFTATEQHSTAPRNMWRTESSKQHKGFCHPHTWNQGERHIADCLNVWNGMAHLVHLESELAPCWPID